MPQPSTVIHLCGELVVQLDGRRVEDRLHGRQGRLLLAYLVLNRGRPVRRDELLELLWPDAAPATGDAALGPPLSRLRSALGADNVVGRSEIVLRLPEGAFVDWEVAHGAVDAAREALAANDWPAACERGTEALSIAGRGLLPGIESAWVDARRAGLEDLRVEALEIVARAGVRVGGPELAHAERAARAAVDAAPFRESARVALMEALHAQGNVAEALRVYESVRTLLREELGTTPGPTLVALHERLVREESAPAGTAAPAEAAGPAASPGARAPDPLVGRERERAQLDVIVTEGLAGAGRALLIEGPAGIGKSRLLAELRALSAARGATVLTARASQLERDFPFGVVRQLFEPHLADRAIRERALAGAAAPAESAISGAAGDGAALDASFAALHGLYWLALNLATDAPLVLVVDDLHWCDVPSLRLVAYLARRIEGQPVLLAMGLRTGEPPPDAALMSEILQDPGLTVLRPQPLETAAVGELIRERLGAEPDTAFRAACHRTTGGNPLLLRQLLTALEVDDVRPDAAHADTVRAIGSRAIASTVQLRLARMSPDAVAVARAIAVLGDDAALPAVTALAELDDERVATATADLARVEILRPGRPLGFVHPLVRDAVYSQILPGERELAHERAARVLHETQAAPERVAAHLLVMPSRGERWVVDVLRRAARAAERSGGSASAVAYLERAVQERAVDDGEAVAIEVELGMAEALTNAAAAATRLRSTFGRIEDPQVRADVANVLGRALMFSGHAAEGKVVARECAASLPAGYEDSWRRLEAFALIANCFEVPDQADFRNAACHRERPLPAGEGAGHLATVAALEWAYGDGGAEECAALAREGFRQGRLMETDNGLLSVAAALVLDLADADEVHDIWDELMALGHAQGSLFAVSSVHLWRGYTFWRRGDLADAEQSLTQAMDEIVLYSYGSEAQSYAGGFLAAVHVDQGEAEAARRALMWAGPVGRTSIGTRYWRLSRLAMLLFEGRYDAALAAADEAQAVHAWIENPADGSALVGRAQALAHLGRREEALEIVQSELARAWRWGAPGTVGPVLRVLGELRGPDGIEELEEAVEILGRSPRRLELARACAALGAVLLESGREGAARDVLRRAYGLAVVSDARALARATAERLVAAGGEPAAPRGPEALTRTERRIAELVADGHDDRSVAQALFLTPRVVEQRLADVQHKLGVSSRQALGTALVG